jgi:hypothetical protein
MAGQQMAAALLVHDRVRRSTELPLFFGRKEKDCITARNLITRLETASEIANWPDDARRCNEFFMILRDRALIWWEMLDDAAVDKQDWNAVKLAFLKAYEPKYTAKTTCTNFGELQQLYNESVHDFSLRLQETFSKVIAAVPADMATVRLAMPAAGAITADTVKEGKAEGMKDMQKFFKHQLFLAGLIDLIRPKVMEAGKADFFDSLDVAREVETINADRKKNAPIKVHTVREADPDVTAAALDDEEIAAINAIREKRGKAPMNKAIGFGNRNIGPAKNVQCRYCKKSGHFQKDCNSRRRDRAPMVDAQGKPYQKRINSVEDGETAEAEKINSVSVQPDSYALNWM